MANSCCVFSKFCIPYSRVTLIFGQNAAVLLVRARESLVRAKNECNVVCKKFVVAALFFQHPFWGEKGSLLDYFSCFSKGLVFFRSTSFSCGSTLKKNSQNFVHSNKIFEQMLAHSFTRCARSLVRSHFVLIHSILLVFLE